MTLGGLIMTEQGTFLRWFLRALGTVSLLAVGAVVMPTSWMDAVHKALGMGPLPAEPIVGYLARSTSAFYAMFGGLLWVLSLDLRRYRPALCYVGAATAVFGLALFGVDMLEGMPPAWRLSEGPFVAALGIVILCGSYRIGPRGGGPSAPAGGESP